MSNSSEQSKNLSYQDLYKKYIKQKEELKNLKISQAMFNSFLSYFPDHIYFKDAESKFIAVGHAMTSWFGAKNIKEVVGKTDFDMFSEEHARAAFKDESSIIKTGKAIVDVVEKETWGGGRVTWVSTTKSPLKDLDGNVIGTFGISRNITEQKLSEEKIIKINQNIKDEINLLRSIMDLIPDFIYIKDENSKIILSNKTYCKFTGNNSEEEIIGKNDFDFFPHNLAEKYINTDKKVISRGRAIRDYEEEGVDLSTGNAVWLSTSKVPLRYYGFNGLLGVSKDITKSKMFVKSLEKAKLEAEASNEAKSAFLAKMSHEIRTPLNGIIGITDLILSSNYSKEDLDNLPIIKESADLLLKIVGDLLDFSKLEAGMLRLESIEFNLRTTIEDIIDIVFYTNNNNLELTLFIDPSIPVKLVGDPGRLRQIIINLLGNAKKFTSKGAISIRVDKKEERNDGVFLKFTIEDTGIGILEDKTEKIFSSFSQADSSITREFGGTGLGLTICKELVSVMQGKIWVQSPPLNNDVGSAFMFTAKFSLLPGLNYSLGSTPALIKNMTLLQLDYSFRVLESQSSMLGSFECKVVSCTTIDESLSLINKVHVDVLVIADDFLRKPESKHFLQVIENKKIPIIVTSMNKFDHDVDGLENINVYSYLRKPIKKLYFVDAIETALSCDLGGGEKERGANEENEIVNKLLNIGKQEKVLLVEDNPVNQKIALAVLKKAGLQVDVVGNGKLATEAVERTHYDLILMDLQMPVMDGLTASRKIRCSKNSSLIPIVALTAQVMPGDYESCMEAGMNDYISKPIKPKYFYKTIYKWLCSNT